MDTAEFAPESTAETHRCESSGSCRAEKLALNERAIRFESENIDTGSYNFTQSHRKKRRAGEREKGFVDQPTKFAFPLVNLANAHFEIAITSQLIPGNL